MSPAGAAATGLVIDGRRYLVAGLEITNVHDDPRATLRAEDCRPRKTRWIRQIILHTTKGIAPQRVRPGAGPPGKHLDVAEFWRKDPEHSGAHIVIGRAGEVSCLADLARVAAYHATVSNEWSVGIEMYQESDGSIREATLASATLLVPALCVLLGIQLQVPQKSYKGRPLGRMADGGPGVVGVLGHRDNTTRRGAGDPGDLIFERLVAEQGAEALITDGGNDLIAWARRQRSLGFVGAQVDGIPGPATVKALEVFGFPSGIYALGSDDQRRRLG